MNLLLFLFSFLLALSFISFSIVSSVEKRRSLVANLETTLELQTELISKLLQQGHRPPSPPPSSSQKERPKRSHWKERRFSWNHPNQKLSLSLHLKEEKREEILPILITYLSFFYPGMDLERLSKELLSKTFILLQQDPEREEILPSELPCPSKDLALLIRGRRGWKEELLCASESGRAKIPRMPPLSDLLILYEKRSRAVACAKHANYPLLVSLLGKEIAEKILKGERERFYSDDREWKFGKRDILSLLKNDLSPILLDDQAYRYPKKTLAIQKKGKEERARILPRQEQLKGK